MTLKIMALMWMQVRIMYYNYIYITQKDNHFPTLFVALDFFEGNDNDSDIDNPEHSPPHGDWTEVRV